MVKHDGKWGSGGVSQSILRNVLLIIKSCHYCTPRTLVCDDYWGSNNTKSACYTLGYSDGTFSRSAGYGWTKSEIPILMDNVKCPPDSTYLLSCSRNAWGANNCGHDEDVILTCT